ncbi:MAG TPA: hypothetical protein EYP98_20170 [Planctomycetes bacterium]|nr:hypothetical protein [Planctomycetota bacterium]
MARRTLLFFLVCLPVRAALAWLAWKLGAEGAKRWQFYALGVVALLMAAGMAARGYQRDQGLVENKGFAGGAVYWNSYVHAAIYAAFGASFLLGVRHAWVLLVVDIAVGLGYFAAR